MTVSGRAGAPLAAGIGQALVVAAIAAVGLMGARAALPALAGWYPQLARPAIALPAAAVLPFWLATLACMAAAAWLVLRAPADSGAAPRARHRAMRAFWIQLALGLAWMTIFFGARDPGWAFCAALILAAAQIVTLLRFLAVERRAGLLLLPALAWTIHATFAGFLIWQLNLKP